ncbi:phosphorylase, partial [bacterium M00.F.Ca.ET.230.01.1.1]
MSNQISLSNSCFLVAGSISNSTNNKKIDLSHRFIKTLVADIINTGGSFISYLSAELVNKNQKPLLFDWTIAREI